VSHLDGGKERDREKALKREQKHASQSFLSSVEGSEVVSTTSFSKRMLEESKWAERKASHVSSYYFSFAYSPG